MNILLLNLVEQNTIIEAKWRLVKRTPSCLAALQCLPLHDVYGRSTLQWKG